MMYSWPMIVNKTASTMIHQSETGRIDLSKWFVRIAGVTALAILVSAVVTAWNRQTPYHVEQSSGVAPSSIFTVTEPPEVPSEVPVFSEVLSIGDADARGGVWYILDSRGRRVHRFAASGELLESFGGQGNGPGEFDRVPTTIVVHEDTIVVAERGENHVHLYSPVGTFLTERLFRLDACMMAEIRDVASTALGLLLLTTCRQEDMRSETKVILEGRDGLMRIVAAQHPNPVGPVVLDALTPSVLSTHPKGFVFGNTGQECLDVYDLEGDRLDSVCHDWLQPLTPPAEFVNEMRSMLSTRTNVRWTLPQQFFPFEAVFVSQSERWIYRVLASDEPISYELVTPDREGTRLLVPRARYVFVHEESALVGWEDLQGTRIATYSLEDR